MRDGVGDIVGLSLFETLSKGGDEVGKSRMFEFDRLKVINKAVRIP